MDKVVIGVDPHKRSATIEVLDDGRDGAGRGPVRHRQRGLPADAGRGPAVSVAACGRSRAATASAGTWPSGWSPTGRPWSTCRRSSSARVAGVLHRAGPQDRPGRCALGRRGRAATPACCEVHGDDAPVALRLLADRRDELGRARTQTINRLHRLLLELVPGGAKRDLSATQARALLATCRPRDVVGRDPPAAGRRTGRRARGIDSKIKARSSSSPPLVAETGSRTDRAARHRPVRRGPAARRRRRQSPGSRPRRTSPRWNGTAPLDASSGDQTRHRLSRAGNRRHQPGPAHHGRRPAAPRHRRPRLLPTASSPPARPRWKPCVPQTTAVRRRLPAAASADAQAEQREAGPGGHPGATLKSSAAGSTPTAGTSDKSLPGPAEHHATPLPSCVLTQRGATIGRFRPQLAQPVRVERIHSAHNSKASDGRAPLRGSHHPSTSFAGSEPSVALAS